MTQAHALAHGFGPPSLSQLLLAAVLCAFVELVLDLASILGLSFRRLPRECHTGPVLVSLSQRDSDRQETHPAAPHSRFHATEAASLLSVTDRNVSSSGGFRIFSASGFPADGEFIRRSRAAHPLS